MDLQEVIEPTRMVTVAMRDHGAIEVPQVDAHGRSVLGKGAGTIASIEEQALAIEFEQGRKAPLLSQRRGLAKESCRMVIRFFVILPPPNPNSPKA
jgi:hypothetical protein